MGLGLGPLPVLKTFGQRAVLLAWRDSERTGDCPLGRSVGAGWWGFPVPTLRYLMAYPVYLLSKETINRRARFRTSARFGSSFLDNPGWDSRWFHRPVAGLPGFSPEEPYPAQTSGGCR